MQSNKQCEQVAQPESVEMQAMREQAERNIQGAIGVVAMLNQAAARAADSGKITLPSAELEHATRLVMDELYRAQEALDAMKQEPAQPALHVVD